MNPSEYTPPHKAEHPELIPESVGAAEQWKFSLLENESFSRVSDLEFLKGWWAICWLAPGLHPDDYEDWEGELEDLAPVAEEAFRRFEVGKIKDSQLYPAEATHNRIWRESRGEIK